MCWHKILSCLLKLHIFASCSSKLVDFEKRGGTPNNSSLSICNKNKDLFNSIGAELSSGDELILANKTFWFNGGIYISHLKNVTIRIDGTMEFQTFDLNAWPGNPEDSATAIEFYNATDLTVTSSHQGKLNGNGKAVYGVVRYFKASKSRPHLFAVNVANNLLIENIFFKDAGRSACIS